MASNVLPVFFPAFASESNMNADHNYFWQNRSHPLHISSQSVQIVNTKAYGEGYMLSLKMGWK